MAGLLKENYRKPKSQLKPCNERLRTLFEKQPPHTVNHAIEMIFEETLVRLKHSACQTFLKEMGMKCRRCCGLVTGKDMEDEKQRLAQQVFNDQEFQPPLDEAKLE